MTTRLTLCLTALLLACGGASAAAAETDRLILKDGRELIGEVLGDDDSNVVRFAMGSSIQEMPRRLVKQVRRGGADQPVAVRPAKQAPAPATVVYQTAPTTVIYQPAPVCAQPVYAAPACGWDRPYISSGWSLNYAVGSSSWGHGRRSGWGLGWTYGVGSRPGWCSPSPWCR